MRDFKQKRKKNREKRTKNKKRAKSQFRKKTKKVYEIIPTTISHEKKPVQCSPAVDGNTVNGVSCFTPQVLKDIKTAYNKNHSESPISSENPNKIWSILKDRLTKEKGCKTEKCWLRELKNSTLQKELEAKLFAPKQPVEWKKNPKEWLSNHDIFNVLSQYQEKYKDFKFMGPTTIDFDKRLPERNGQCVENQLCNFDLKKDISRGIRHFACVFNLDESWEDGSHWVSMYIDIPEKFIFFFDSGGASNTPPEITALVKRIQTQGMKLVPKLDFQYYSNTQNQHQKGTTECGMYSIFFVITMLTGKTPFYGDKVLSMKERIDLFLEKKIPDEVVFDYRDLYFNAGDE
jgi:hypothetical protein